MFVAGDRARRNGLRAATSTQNSDDESWGLSFASSNGAQMDLFGNFFGSSLISVGTGGSTQLGRSSETWVMGGGIDSTMTGGVKCFTACLQVTRSSIPTGQPPMVVLRTATYYAIVIDTDTVQLAQSVANATRAQRSYWMGPALMTPSLTVSVTRLRSKR